MFVDFRASESGDTFTCDICIVGSGPAGTSLAREFAGTQIDVCLIESGGFEFDSETQALYEGETRGIPHTDLDASRLRYLGGSSNCWNGWCAPFDAYDFEAKDWVPYSGWPIGYDDLADHYARANAVCEIGPWDYGGGIWDELGLSRPELDDRRLRFCHWRKSPPTRFGERYRSDLEAAGNVTVLLNANAVAVETPARPSEVSGIRIKSLDGREGTVRARHYVLACGGIETPRLLLASNATQTAGLGNGHDQVGRYFMEHPYATSAVAFSTPQNFLPSVEKAVGDVPVDIGFCSSPRLQARERVMGSMLLIEPKSGYENLFSWGRRDLPEAPEGTVRYIFLSQSEQSPDPASRILLSETRDALGSPQAVLDWRLNELDKRSIIAQVRALGAEFSRLGLGRIKLADWLLDGDAFWGVRAGNHHMGTTRMGDDPKTSVVDRNCTVHGIGNLHIASSSVFTTSSWANPTLTIVALALRLADHLKRDFA